MGDFFLFLLGWQHDLQAYPKMGCGFAQNTGVQLKFMQNLS